MWKSRKGEGGEEVRWRVMAGGFESLPFSSRLCVDYLKIMPVDRCLRDEDYRWTIGLG